MTNFEFIFEEEMSFVGTGWSRDQTKVETHLRSERERERERGSERGMEAKMGLEKEEERQR